MLSDRTTVDRQLDELRRSNAVRVMQVGALPQRAAPKLPARRPCVLCQSGLLGLTSSSKAAAAALLVLACVPSRPACDSPRCLSSGWVTMHHPACLPTCSCPPAKTNLQSC